MLAAARGDISEEEALEKTEFGSWRLVRKQRTWARGLGWASVSRILRKGKGSRTFGPPTKGEPKSGDLSKRKKLDRFREALVCSSLAY